MAIIKCKMCGGDLNVAGDSQIAVCEYCGTQQTVPKQDNEKKLTLFARANRLRFSCEFDKAAGVYESIVAEFPEEPEAYWGLVLCKYGIEYVDDPATGKKVPTCHRSSFDSVLEDANFELVMEYSDVVTRKIYREEAKAIEELRRGCGRSGSAQQFVDPAQQILRRTDLAEILCLQLCEFLRHVMGVDVLIARNERLLLSGSNEL